MSDVDRLFDLLKEVRARPTLHGKPTSREEVREHALALGVSRMLGAGSRFQDQRILHSADGPSRRARVNPIPSPTTPEPPDDPVLILIAGLAAIGVVVVVSVGLMAAGWVLRGVVGL